MARTWEVGMPEFGPYTRWRDPRLHDYAYVAGRSWGARQARLLLGQDPWYALDWSIDHRCSAEALLLRLAKYGLHATLTSPMGFTRRATEDTVREAGTDTVTIGLHPHVDLPPASPLLAEVIGQNDLRFNRVLILRLEGPVERVGPVHIWHGAVMTQERGLMPDVYVVGHRHVAEPWQRGPDLEDTIGIGPLREERSRIRPTLRSARHVARTIFDVLPMWEAWQNGLFLRAEAKRQAAEEAGYAQAADDPTTGLEAFTP